MTARVLIVDDVLPNLKLLEAKLTREYFEVILASNGPDALQAMRYEVPDVVLLDVMMPGMDGFEVCRRARQDPAISDIPIVMVTALDQAKDRIEGLKAGADDFLTKPIKEVALFARIKSLVRLKSILDELNNRENASGIFQQRSDDTDRRQISDASIVVVSDEAELDDMVAQHLKVFGRVTHAPAQADIPKILSTANHDLVIVDLESQVMDGLRFVSYLRSHRETRALPIVAMVDEDQEPRLIRALEMGVNDYVLKPVNGLELSVRAKTQLKRKRLSDRLRDNFHMSIKLATTDAVTGIYNRHYMTTHLNLCFERAKAEKRPLSLGILDIDHFKSVNDTYGHAGGDDVLREFAERIRSNLRGIDIVARYGGEEFVVIMPDTKASTAMMVAERLRRTVEEERFTVSTHPEKIPVTVSIGIAALEDCDQSGSDIIERADEALYDAKGTGRNRVSFADPADLLPALKSA